MNKNITNSMLAKSQQNKSETCLEVYDYLNACNDKEHEWSYESYENRMKFAQRNGPGGMTYDFGSDS